MTSNTIQVLDHGHVKLLNVAGVDGPGHDRDPANAARMSFNQSNTHTEEQDFRLNHYLMRNKHTSPFEMVEIWLEMKLPIFVARQFVRHRTVSINEASARYITLPEEWYIPRAEHIGIQPPDKKQGRDMTQRLSEYQIAWFQTSLNDACHSNYQQYLDALSRGVPAELARCFLHLNHYTIWLWKQDLHNIMHFLSLRDHDHAQFESQEYARAVDTLIRRQLPQVMSLYDEFRRLP